MLFPFGSNCVKFCWCISVMVVSIWTTPASQCGWRPDVACPVQTWPCHIMAPVGKVGGLSNIQHMRMQKNAANICTFLLWKANKTKPLYVYCCIEVFKINSTFANVIFGSGYQGGVCNWCTFPFVHTSASLLLFLVSVLFWIFWFWMWRCTTLTFMHHWSQQTMQWELWQ